MLETMCHSLQSQEQVGFGTGLVQALARQVICFHSRSGSSLLQLGTGDDSRVERSWRRFLRKHRPSTSTSYERQPTRREHRPKLHFCSAGSFIRITSPTFKGTRFLVPWLYCLHCCLFRAAKLLAVVFRSLFGWSKFSAVGSKVQVRRPISL